VIAKAKPTTNTHETQRNGVPNCAKQAYLYWTTAASALVGRTWWLRRHVNRRRFGTAWVGLGFELQQIWTASGVVDVVVVVVDVLYAVWRRNCFLLAVAVVVGKVVFRLQTVIAASSYAAVEAEIIRSLD